MRDKTLVTNGEVLYLEDKEGNREYVVGCCESLAYTTERILKAINSDVTLNYEEEEDN